MRRALGVAVTLLLAVVIGVPSPASGAYPGRNGRIAFLREGNIWTVRPDGTGPVRLTSLGPNGSADWPAWSPDGRRIAYRACRMYDSALNCDIWTMDADGSSKTRITTHGADESQPTWSPDGRWLAFTSDRKVVYPDDFFSEDLIYRLRSTFPYGRAIAVTQPPSEDDPYFGAWVGDASPDWSPLGDVIAFMRTTHTGSSGGFGSDLHEVAWTGGAPTKVRPEFVGEHWPSWNPRGTRIAYTSGFTYLDRCVDLGLGDSANVFHMTAAGTEETQVTPYIQGSYRLAWYPAWSPDGRWIVFSRLRIIDPCGLGTMRERIFKVRSGGTAAPVFVIGNGTHPDWQPVLPS